MLKISWKRGEIAHEEQFLLLFTMFCYLMLDFCVRTRVRFSLRDKRLFQITEVEITRVDCIYCRLSIMFVLPLTLKQPTACLLAFNNVITGTDDNFATSDELVFFYHRKDF